MSCGISYLVTSYELVPPDYPELTNRFIVPALIWRFWLTHQLFAPEYRCHNGSLLDQERHRSGEMGSRRPLPVSSPWSLAKGIRGGGEHLLSMEIWLVLSFAQSGSQPSANDLMPMA